MNIQVYIYKCNETRNHLCIIVVSLYSFFKDGYELFPFLCNVPELETVFYHRLLNWINPSMCSRKLLHCIVIQYDIINVDFFLLGDIEYFIEEGRVVL